MGSLDNAMAAKAALEEALRTVPGQRVYPDVGPAVDPPGTVVAPPALQWEGACTGPTSARFLVWLVVTNDDRAPQRLLTLLEPVTEALDAVDDAVVVRADPGRYPITNGDLPAYEIQVDYAL